MSSAIDLDVDDSGIAAVTWSPAALDGDGIEALANAIERVAGDAAIVGAVLAGSVASFCGTFDLDWLAATTARSDGAAVLRHAVARLNAALWRLETSGKPVVAAIDGDALGVGFEVALACGERIASARPDVQLGLTDVKLGLPPAAGGALRLARLIGVAKARTPLLAGQAMTPTQALKLGLIDAIVAPDELLDAARRRVRQGLPPRARHRGDVVPVGPPDAHAPARGAIDATLGDGVTATFDAALGAAAERFVEVACGSVARAMLRTLGLGVARANALERRPAGHPRHVFGKVGVLGAGLMGSGIAWVCARAGLDVVLVDVSDAAAQRGLARLGVQERAAVAAGRSDADASQAALARIVATARYEALHDVDIVVEAVFEDRAVKAEATRRAEAQIGSGVVFATNTSTLPIHGLAAGSARPDLFIGLHFFSPVPRMPLLEIIRGTQTSDATLATSMDFAQRIGKTPIVVNDARGFYTTRVVMAYQAEAFDMLAQGVAPEAIEEGGLAGGMPVPPLALSDAVALDLIHQINVQTRQDLGAAYRQSAGYDVVGRMVETLGRTGKKSGKGFYDYDADGRKSLWPGLRDAAAAGRRSDAGSDDLRDRLLGVQALETARALQEGVIVDPSEADLGAILGWGFAPWTGGPLSYIDGQGVARFVARCDELADRYGGERLRPTRTLREIAARHGSVYATDWTRPLRAARTAPQPEPTDG
jgi:3-hydroxyacyl-CoA dehydrogenase/enoyl-CoA hydratase/3-hydroxybutyryl-CoA epimerase